MDKGVTRVAGDRRAGRERIGREVLALLVLKAIALGVLWLLFFPDSRRPVVDATAMQRHLQPAAPLPATTDRISESKP